MKTKATNPVTLLRKPSLPIIEMFFEIAHLKQLYRQGWLNSSISRESCESVAEHTFGVAVLAMTLADMYFPDLNREKVLQMALIHDLGEVYAGDIVPEDRISSEKKYQLEKESVSRILEKILPGQKYLSLWKEFETGESLESQFIRQVDKLEMAFQASIYEHQHGVDLDDFFDSAKKELKLDKLHNILSELENIR
jgi:putative hydrolase of HD superfamily